ncbi:MAG: hypothetical protein CVU91_12140 [Firmicutes bacterium HGW-Firmicutes-16]|nr:MAG: hypothetical protein CVU91_12140 [Firmicutes bacterium HGW-Firmicutes-16]
MVIIIRAETPVFKRLRLNTLIKTIQQILTFKRFEIDIIIIRMNSRLCIFKPCIIFAEKALKRFIIEF